MRVQTRIFELPRNGYKNMAELARAMGISVSQIYRVREGKRPINQKFIVGAIRAFPEYNLDNLFYLAPDVPPGNNHNGHRRLTGRAKAAEKQPVGSAG